MHKVCGFHCENSTSFIKASQLRGYLEPKSHKYFRNTTHLSPKASEKTFSRSSVLWNSPFFFFGSPNPPQGPGLPLGADGLWSIGTLPDRSGGGSFDPRRRLSRWSHEVWFAT